MSRPELHKFLTSPVAPTGRAEKKCMKTLSILLTIGLFSVSAQAVELSFDSDMQVKKVSEKTFSTVKSGESLKLAAGEGAIVVPPKSIPVLVYNPSSDKNGITLKDSQFEQLLLEKTQSSIQAATNEIVRGLRQAEAQIQKRDYLKARSDLDSLKRKYPQVSSILFLSGTANYLANDRKAAIDDLNQGLVIDPQNEEAKKLLQQLRGTP